MRVAVVNMVQYLSVRDIIMHVCVKNGHDAMQIFRRINDLEKREFRDSLIKFKFPGRGQSLHPVIKLPDSIKLVMMLPGRNALRYRSKFADIISRYLDGDMSLCLEIEENKLIGQQSSYGKFAQTVEEEIIADECIADMNFPAIGYVYATQSNAFPGLVKIGRTYDMKARLSQLNVSCAPEPHVVIALAPTFDMKRDEKDAHMFFDSFRVEGEFFAVSNCQVKKYFHENIMVLHQEELLQYIHAGEPGSQKI